MVKLFAETNQTSAVENNNYRTCEMQKSGINRRQPLGSGGGHTENYKQHAKAEVLIYNVPGLSR
jgi:hypothetical protein